MLSEADRALGELAGLGRTIPNPHLLISPFMRREAVLSSRIEGTYRSAQQNVEKLVQAGILKQWGHASYSKWFFAEEILLAIGDMKRGPG